MPKILLFRVAHDLSASLVSDLSRAGYDVATPETADVSTVLQQQPDLILLQTDVRTLDSTFAVPILRAASMLEAPRRRVAADLGQPHSAR
jgi:hypothetical protein